MIKKGDRDRRGPVTSEFPGRARTMDFNANDVGCVPPVAGHYIENTVDTDLVFREMFQGRPIHRFLHEQLDQTSPFRDGDSHLNIDEVTVKKIPIENRAVIAG